MDRRLLGWLRREGPTSRGGFSRGLGVRPNTVGGRVGALLAGGWLVEIAGGAGADSEGAGRPAVPVGLNVGVTGPWLAGLSLGHGGAEGCAVRLDGRLCPGPRGPRAAQRVGDLNQISWSLVLAMRGLLERNGAERLSAVGLAVPGFVDQARRVLLFSSASSAGQPGGGEVSLAPLWDELARVGLSDVPVVVDNDMHALAARWGWGEGASAGDQDVLLVRVGDGQLGAAMLIGGRPHRGALVGGNELGHMRMGVSDARCYCGGRGCLERLVSTEYLRSLCGAVGVRTLAELAASFNADQDDPAQRALADVLSLLSDGLVNAIHLLRPHRVVIVSEFTRFANFRNALLGSVKASLMPGLSEAVAIQTWDEPVGAAAETASYLALNSVMRPPTGRA